ncbi:YkvA family protein [Erwiniaceae bacterium BAC15a-03b]|uniref:YkvA family protein n=1 Tax=Winslowiella arboricola TaxID=2978220 RepID=A0A9J6PN63_9GAMM|nr:YkvA family protein [Winslowiella arboricola]MCU5772453.1 YkvA family protein [Winslowiella arboricola]MCU5779753.1 YkvA family protein [Winslowiella arboricola]
MPDTRDRTITGRAKQWARNIKRDVHAVWLAGRDPGTPWYAKLLALIVAAYAVSPIDLIPDFIPVIGYLDDLILVPLGIMLVVRLIPPEIMDQHRKTASQIAERPVSRVTAAVFIAIWIAGSILLTRAFFCK